MIEIAQVTKSYGRRRALDGAAATFAVGRIVGLVGENGSGKSTLLKMMAGLLRPDSGSVLLDGKPVTRALAGRRIAYMADADLFFPYFTIDQLFGFYDTQFDDFSMEKAYEAADFLRLDRTSKLKNLSKGNRGRAKIAATLARQADVYLLDEPFSGLDPMVREEIVKGLIRFTDPERQTVIMTTHELQDAAPLLDEIAVMKGGRIIAHERTEDIRDEHRGGPSAWMKSLYEKESEPIGAHSS
ncbi:ABC transporter ATP-binding protein [Edaphobacillus lindanitolerans]|uniref:ABC-2 type transport system ATP-binding protein n=1 Tax=Edaphobacillus lindanitolerans TaxID=550447 RepID=A0A1U7PR04_9BACI|nr:ABC transporter ATP-binding protein [Edaphobacillus lindanitolerans]SIT87217.1 ABC-2 type transport system ATP-binding protein [Edaphobacillus lindanitolerans]